MSKKHDISVLSLFWCEIGGAAFRSDRTCNSMRLKLVFNSKDDSLAAVMKPQFFQDMLEMSP